MPTLTTQEPDTLDLDFFYKNVTKTYGTYGVAIYEDNPLIVKPIPKASIQQIALIQTFTL